MPHTQRSLSSDDSGLVAVQAASGQGHSPGASLPQPARLPRAY